MKLLSTFFLFRYTFGSNILHKGYVRRGYACEPHFRTRSLRTSHAVSWPSQLARQTDGRSGQTDSVQDHFQALQSRFDRSAGKIVAPNFCQFLRRKATNSDSNRLGRPSTEIKKRIAGIWQQTTGDRRKKQEEETQKAEKSVIQY